MGEMAAKMGCFGFSIKSLVAISGFMIGKRVGKSEKPRQMSSYQAWRKELMKFMLQSRLEGKTVIKHRSSKTVLTGSDCHQSSLGGSTHSSWPVSSEADLYQIMMVKNFGMVRLSKLEQRF